MRPRVEQTCDLVNQAQSGSTTLAKKLEPFGMTLPAQPNTPEAFHDAKQTAYQGELAKMAGRAGRTTASCSYRPFAASRTQRSRSSRF